MGRASGAAHRISTDIFVLEGERHFSEKASLLGLIWPRSGAVACAVLQA